MPQFRDTKPTPKFSEFLVFGNSYGQLNTAGASRVGHRWSTRLAAMLGAREWNVATNGSRIIWPDSGPNGGWNTVFHSLLRNREIARATGSGYPNESSICAMWYGGNDFPRLGTAKVGTTGPYGNALRACISRYRASRMVASNHSSIVYATTANWSSDTGSVYGGPPTGAGEVAHRTAVAAPGNITITVPTDVEAGSVVTLYFPVDSASTAGVAAVTLNGSAVAGSGLTIGGTSVFDNSADTSGAAAVTANRQCVTCLRVPITVQGTNTIVITMTGVGGAGLFGGYSIEGLDPAILIVPNFPKMPTAVGYGLWRMPQGSGWQGTTNQFPATDTGAGSADSLFDAGNATTQSVCAEFGSRVLYIDVDGALAKNALYWPSADQHINDRGNAIVARLMFDAVQNLYDTLPSNSIALANVDTLGGDSPSDQYVTSPGKVSTASSFGRSRSAVLYIPAVLGEAPITKTLVANTELSLVGGQRYLSLTDYSEFRIIAQITTALANARMYLSAQPIFGYVTMDYVTPVHPEYGALDCSSAGIWASPWTALSPLLRRGDFNIRLNLYGSTAGNLGLNNVGYEFR